MAQNKTKMSKIGGVWSKNKDPNSFSIKLGSTGNKDPKYDLSVEITVKNGLGQVVAKQTDGWLTLKDPRQGTFLSDEQKEKIPSTLQFDVLVPNN